jgi:hypothetical protein
LPISTQTSNQACTWLDLNPFATFNSFRMFNDCRFRPKLQTKHVHGSTQTGELAFVKTRPRPKIGPQTCPMPSFSIRATNTQLAGFKVLRTTSQLIIFSSMGSWIHTQWPFQHFFRSYATWTFMIHTCNIIFLWW